MHRMPRATGTLALVVLLAACAAPGAGAGAGDQSDQTDENAATSAATDTSPSASAAASPTEPAPADETGLDRVDIGVLAADPSSFTGQQVRVLARVDEVLADGAAFLTSPSASEQGQIAVILVPDAQIDKEPEAGRVVWVEGTVVGVTDDELQSAGAELGIDELQDFEGEFAVVATSIGDPLAES